MKQISQNWRQILSIQIGGAICLPIIMIGQMIGSDLGFRSGLLAIFLGNLFLLVLSIPMAIISYQKRKPSSEIANFFFGKRTKKLFSIIFSLAMLIWFSLQLNIISASIFDLLTLMNSSIKINLISLNIILGMIMSLVAIFGIKTIKFLASFSVPILIGVLIYATISAPVPNFTSSFASLKMASITSLIGANIVVVIDMPTYFQYAKKKKDSLIASILLFAFGIPLIECIGLYLGASRPNASLLTALVANGAAIVGVFVGFFVIFAGWTTNNMNLYSGAINSIGIFSKSSYKTRASIIGLLGTIASCFPIVNNITIVLAILGISLSAIGGVCLASYLMSYLLKKELTKYQQKINLIIFVISTLFGLFSSFEFIKLTFLDVLDTFLVASIFSILSRILFKARGEAINYETDKS